MTIKKTKKIVIKKEEFKNVSFKEFDSMIKNILSTPKPVKKKKSK
jgi:hypothetical protein